MNDRKLPGMILLEFCIMSEDNFYTRTPVYLTFYCHFSIVNFHYLRHQ